MIKGYTLAEHKAKKLVVPELEERMGVTGKIQQESVRVLNESAQGKNRKLIVQMEAIHVGRTLNYTYYTEEGLTAGLETWTHPYPKPVLTHHNDWNGEPIGRILKAEYSKVTPSGKPGLMFTCEITDPVAQEKVLDGRYQTVSIGASTDKCVCNICGTDRVQEWCDHWPGESYGEGTDQQTCHFIVGTTMGKEVSYVNTPADSYAGNVSVTTVEGDQGQQQNGTKESVQTFFQITEGVVLDAQAPNVNLYESFTPDQRKFIDTLLKLNEGSVAKMDPDPENNPNNQNPPVVPVQEGQTPAPTVAPTAAPTVPVQEGQTPPAVPPTAAPAAPTVPVQEGLAFTDLTEANKQITLLNGTIARLVTEKQTLEGQVTEQQNTYQTLLAENQKLIEKNHQNLAEKVVTLKKQLGKPDVAGVNQEEAVNQHLTRTAESLENTLNDLLTEAKNFRPQPGSVQNPGFSEGDNNPSGGGEKMTVAEAEGIFKNMFKGMRR
jgi:hypothetical protein